MVTTSKALGRGDTATAKTLLNEAVPITGTIVSGTYNDLNIKNQAHGMFQSVYDYPYLSSSANHIFDLTVGYSPNSSLSSSDSVQNAKKINVYNQMAQICRGYDLTGSIKDFHRDGLDSNTGEFMRECVFISLSRLLVKDEIKKGTLKLTFLTGSHTRAPLSQSVITEYDATNTFKVNSPAGDYTLLYTGSTEAAKGHPIGHCYHQAGLIVLTASVFSDPGTRLKGEFGPPESSLDTGSIDRMLTGSSISSSCDAVRNRMQNLVANNVTELNSTIYFCRINHGDFNYSSNPSYLSGSQIVTKKVSTDEPVSYITTVGLYDTNDTCLAVAKLSEPLKKTPSNEFVLRVRLDY